MEESPDFDQSDTPHLLTWDDLCIEMIELCIARNERNAAVNPDTSHESPFDYPHLSRTTELNPWLILCLNRILDIIVDRVSLKRNDLMIQNVQLKENASLEELSTRFNNLRRHELLNTELVVLATLIRDTFISIDETLLDIKQWLNGQSKLEKTQPEIECIQISVFGILKQILSMTSDSRQEALNTERFLQIPFGKDIKPELERLVARVFSKHELKSRVNLMIEKIGKLRSNKLYVHEILKRVDTYIRLLIENIYLSMNTIYEVLKLYDVREKIEIIKGSFKALHNKGIFVAGVQQEIRLIKEAIDTIPTNMSIPRIDIIKYGPYLFHRIFEGFRARQQREGMLKAGRMVLDNNITVMNIRRKLLLPIDEYIMDRDGHEIQELKDAIDLIRAKIDTFVDEESKIQQEYDTLVDVESKIQQEYDRARDAQNIREVLSFINAALDIINTMSVTRNEIKHTCDEIETMLENITITDTGKQIRQLFCKTDARHIDSDEGNELRDIRIILSAMSEVYFTSESQRTLNNQTTCVNEEDRLIGILTAVQIMLHQDAARINERQKEELQSIHKIVKEMIEPLILRQTELRDIQEAVRIMLDRLVKIVNYRGRFRISQIESCGSKAENTAVLKYDETGEKYTESDYLAVLDYSSEIVHRDNGCRELCVEVSGLPMSSETHDDVDIEAISRLKETSGERVLCDRLFWRELHKSMGSLCNCFTVQFDEKNVWYYVSYSSSGSHETVQQTHCSSCAVEMPTGVLKVNDSISFGGPEDTKCSLAFIWTSKAKCLFGSDKLLKEDPKQISSLQVHVDFLPALEVNRATADEGAREHDFFLVPKHCNVCDRKTHWRKSKCMQEIAYMVNEMTEKHRRCYRIIKYWLSTTINENSMTINWYHVKTVALNHSRECSDPSEGCAKCVLDMLTDLKHAYETKTLNSFHESDVNILGPYYQSLSYTGLYVKFLNKFIDRLYSFTDTDSCELLLQRLQH